MKQSCRGAAAGAVAALCVVAASCVALGLGGCAAAPRAAAAAPKVSDAVVRQYAEELARARHHALDAQILQQARREVTLQADLAQAALRQGLQHEPAVAARLRLVRRIVLADELLKQQLRAHPVTEADLRAAYQRFVQAYGRHAYQLEQIIAPSAGQASQVLQRLAGGESFRHVMQRFAHRGEGWSAGSLGWVRQGQLSPRFAGVVSALRPGEYTTQPVHDTFGWHVLLLQGERDIQAPPLQSVRQQLASRIQLERVRRFEASFVPAAVPGAQS